MPANTRRELDLEAYKFSNQRMDICLKHPNLMAMVLEQHTHTNTRLPELGGGALEDLYMVYFEY